MSTGINALKGSVINEIPSGRVDMPDLLRTLVSQGKSVSTLTMQSEWRDLGRPEDLIAANEKIAASS